MDLHNDLNIENPRSIVIVTTAPPAAVLVIVRNSSTTGDGGVIVVTMSHQQVPMTTNKVILFNDLKTHSAHHKMRTRIYNYTQVIMSYINVWYISSHHWMLVNIIDII